MARYAYVNGRYVDHRQARVHIEDRGYQLADGVYEVVGVSDGRLIDEAPHIDRLDRSLRELRIAWPVSRAALSYIVRELMRRNRLRDGLVYIQVTRGVARRDHAFPTTPIKPALVLTTKNTKRAEADPGPGIAVKSQPDIRWERCDIKTVALLPNVLAKQAAREVGAYEAWLVDRDGRVTEGASTNAWIVTHDDELVTRQTDTGILAGITRLTLKSLAKDLQLKVVERPFTLAEAKRAKEAFISSATSFVTPVVKIDGEPVGDGKVGPTARRLREEYVRFATSGGNNMNRSEGVKAAKQETTRWVVALEVRSFYAESGQKIKPEQDELYVEFSVIEPVTGKVKRSGRTQHHIYQNGKGGISLPSKNGPVYSEYSLKQAGVEAADRILAGFDIKVRE